MPNPIEARPMYYGCYADQQESGKLENRTFGAQVVIVSRDGKIWVRFDRDGGRVEAHVGPNGVVFSNSKLCRFNAASGGMKGCEGPYDTAIREMSGEIGLKLGAGLLARLDGIPLVAGYQEKDGQSYVLAVVMMLYMPTAEEESLLATKGFFTTVDLLNKAIENAEDAFRPNFTFALQIIKMQNSNQLIREVVEYNQRLHAAVRSHFDVSCQNFHSGIWDYSN